VRVRTPQSAGLAPILTAAGATVHDDGGGQLTVSGLTADRIGDLAFDRAIRLHELAPALASLEQAFMELTSSSVDFRAGAIPGAPDPDAAVLAAAGSGI
jgi:ABC-2 type transport system ATP-binding protein